MTMYHACWVGGCLGWVGVGGREVPSGVHAADMAMLKCMLVWVLVVVGEGGRDVCNLCMHADRTTLHTMPAGLGGCLGGRVGVGGRDVPNKRPSEVVVAAHITQLSR